MKIALEDLRFHYVALGLEVLHDTPSAKRVGPGMRLFYVIECDGHRIKALDSLGRSYGLAVRDVCLRAVYDTSGKKCEYEIEDRTLLVQNKSKPDEWLALFPWPEHASGARARPARAASSPTGG